MFKFLKEKIKNAVSKISKKVEKEPIEKVEPIEEKEVEQKEVEKKKEEKKDVRKKKEEVKPKEKRFFKGLKQKITTAKISESKFDDFFWDLEVSLMENNVAVEVIDKIKQDLKEQIVDRPIKRNEIKNYILKSLKGSVSDLLDMGEIDLIKEIKRKKPFVIVFFGINGSGKTTTIAKVANLILKEKFSCVLAAADTFRAASEEQLQEHANKLKIKLIKHSYGADPAAVAFDAIKHASAKMIDVVLIDTAGRMHTNVNLMDEMKKIVRVAKPDLKIFVGEAITGNDCVEQAKKFNEVIGIDAIILTKIDVDEKGGAAISISHITKKPILYVGTGQEYKDLKEFDKEEIMKSLGFE